MIRNIGGTWFEFRHGSDAEGKYWNDTVRGFTEAQWKDKIREISDAGMKYIVLMSTRSVRNGMEECYFRTERFREAGLTCKDPLETLLAGADEYGLKVFVSCGFYGDPGKASANRRSEAVREKAFAAIREIQEKYGNHPSFYGWYLPDEYCIIRRFSRRFTEFANRYAGYIHRISPGKKILIAPYGTLTVKADRKYTERLRKLDVDFIAYQDEVGVKKSTPERVEKKFRALKKAHDEAGKSRLWADIELFDFEGPVYLSALIPAKSGRILKQIKAVSPYAEEILCYQFEGLCNEENSASFCGHPSSAEYLKELRSAGVFK